jgi:hypothetical protein
MVEQQPSLSLEDILLRSGFDERRVNIVKFSIVNSFSNGKVIAEIVHFHLPKIVHFAQVLDETSRTKKLENWNILKPALQKLNLPLKDSQIAKIVDREWPKEDLINLANHLYEQIQLYSTTQAMASASIKENSPLKKKGKNAKQAVHELDDTAKRQFMDSQFELISEKSRREYRAIVQEVDRMETRSTLLDTRLNQFREENLEELKKSEKRLSKLKFELDIALVGLIIFILV